MVSLKQWRGSSAKTFIAFCDKNNNPAAPPPGEPFQKQGWSSTKSLRKKHLSEKHRAFWRSLSRFEG